MNRYYQYLDKLNSLEGKTFIVTGANSGLGLQTTIDLVYKKAHVIMACRNISKAEKVKNEIRLKFNDANIDIIQYDQSSFVSIDSFCDEIKNKYSQIDGLICNAGVYFQKKNMKTKEGIDLTFGTNYLGVYYLINRLFDYLDKSFSKVLIVTSLTATFAKKNTKIKTLEKLNRNQLYGYSKYCLSRLCYELDKKSKNIEFYLTHPGICQTNIISSETSGLPNWFSKIGHGFLYLFVHKSSKACLTNLYALSLGNNKQKFIKPRGLFAISGYPKAYLYPQYCQKEIIEETKNYLKERGYKC